MEPISDIPLNRDAYSEQEWAILAQENPELAQAITEIEAAGGLAQEPNRLKQALVLGAALGGGMLAGRLLPALGPSSRLRLS